MMNAPVANETDEKKRVHNVAVRDSDCCWLEVRGLRHVRSARNGFQHYRGEVHDMLGYCVS